ncbi:lysozyme inhibitor LprI family protein [Leisingera aquimarina]|uniref:lysozyme inhibitor LprI family protein n=1 Tax=Leisingera aquimarina TaxID=476529 RepID=UPI00040CEE82|nr:lysozyme inhibitor LprI family protein [Leisingera aquimarina]
MKTGLLLALLMAGTSVMAQEVHFSSGATAACVAGAANQDARRGCLGTSAQHCMGETPDGSTTVGMMGCLDGERSYWDQRLNRAYKSMRTKAEALDAEMEELGSAVPKTAPALRGMQRAWIIYRDATCDFERSQWGGGTGGGPAVLSCLMRLTGEQALYLEDAWFGE